MWAGRLNMATEQNYNYIDRHRKDRIGCLYCHYTQWYNEICCVVPKNDFFHTEAQKPVHTNNK